MQESQKNSKICNLFNFFIASYICFDMFPSYFKLKERISTNDKYAVYIRIVVIDFILKR